MDKSLTEQILGAAMRVHTARGVGVLEKVYEKARVYQLRKRSFSVLQPCPTPVFNVGGGDTYIQEPNPL